MEKKRKKLPIFTYMCFLLGMTVMFTGVTLSRYVNRSEGASTATLSPFVYSYEIKGFSSLSFSNFDYWLDLDGQQVALNTPHYIEYTLRNYRRDSEGNSERISDVDLKPTLRFYAEAEFVDFLAIQVAKSTADSVTAVTSQYVLGNLIYQVEEDKDGLYQYPTGADGKETYDYASHSNATFETQKFNDYNALTATDETLTVTGDIDSASVVSFVSDTGTSVKISAQKDAQTNYSLGFRREKDATLVNPLYIDCRKQATCYAVDITLPESEILKGGTAQEATYRLYLTTTKKISRPELGLTADTKYATDPEYTGKYVDINDILSGTTKTLSGADVLGYHYDVSADAYSEPGTLASDGHTTMVRIKTLLSEGGSKTEYYHIAVSADGESSVGYAHLLNGTAGYVTCNDGKWWVNADDLPGDPRGTLTDSVYEYSIGDAISRSYPLQMNVLFVQASETP